MNQDAHMQRVDVDALAAGNPAINASRFKQWRRKMVRIERLGLDADPPQPPPQPRGRRPEVPNGRGLLPIGNF